MTRRRTAGANGATASEHSRRPAIGGLAMGSYTVLLFRYGLVATICGAFVADFLLATPLTLELGARYAGPTYFAVTVVLLIGLAAFRSAHAGPAARQRFATSDSARSA